MIWVFFFCVVTKKGIEKQKRELLFFSRVIKIVVLGSENFVFTLLKWKSSPACVQYGMCLYNVFACREGQSQVGVSAYVLVYERERETKNKCPNFIYSTWEKQSFFLRFLGETKLIGAFYFCLLCLCPIWIIKIKKSNVIMCVASCLNYELPNLFGLLIMARLTINMSLLWHLNFASP